MSNFVFDDSLKLGIAEIDEQHGRFIGYLNDAKDAVEQGQDVEELLSILNRLLDYTMEHFTSEEALMRQYEYPDFQTHKEHHDKTAAELFEFDLRLLAGDPKESRAFLEFLTDWLQHHLLVSDKELAEFLKQKGVS